VEEGAVVKGTCMGEVMFFIAGHIGPNFSCTAPDVGDKCKCKTPGVITEKIWSAHTLKTEGNSEKEIPTGIT